MDTNNKTLGKLYMVPTYVAEVPAFNSFPGSNAEIIRQTKHFVVENERTARRFLKSIDRNIDIDTLTMTELSEHTPEKEIPTMLAPALNGNDVIMISEAGCPGVADPGATLAAEAHRCGVRVVPLVGPSSLLMSLMASGLNGQNFAFAGYLPIGPEIAKKLRLMEDRSFKERQTQMFIEAPYRNDKMFQALVSNLKNETRLCVARDVMGPEEYIVTRKISEWKKCKAPELHKRPTVFLFLA